MPLRLEAPGLLKPEEAVIASASTEMKRRIFLTMKMKTTMFLLVVVTIVVAVCLLSLYNRWGVGSKLYKYTDAGLGTKVHLTLVAESQKAASDAARRTFSFIHHLQRDFDYRNPEGSVYRINRVAGKTAIKPSSRVFDLIERTVEFARMTGGVFDPTIGALTTMPLFYALDDAVAKRKTAFVGHRLVKLNKAQKTVFLCRPGMALDLGGVAKGAILDAAVNLLRRMYIKAGIVEAGGDMYCFGERDWEIGIRNPGDKTILSSFTVRERGVCGSGGYQQYVALEEGGATTLRHHIIDPNQMKAADKTAGVTVIAESAELADALATTLFIMGDEKGKPFVRDHFPDVAAMWVAFDGSVTTTQRFP